MRGGAEVDKGLFGGIGAQKHRKILVEQVATGFAARLGHAQVDPGVAQLLVALDAQVEQRVAEHHGVGADILGTRLGERHERTLLPARGERGADVAARRKAHDDDLGRVDIPLLGIRAHRGDHACKVGLGIGIGHVARLVRNVVERDSLKPAREELEGHGLLLVLGNELEGPATDDDRAGALGASGLGHLVGKIDGVGRGTLRCGFVAPKGACIDDHENSSAQVRLMCVRAGFNVARARPAPGAKMRPADNAYVYGTMANEHVTWIRSRHSNVREP